MQFHSHLRRPLLLFAPVTVSKYFMFHYEHACSKPSVAHWTNLGEYNKFNQRRCLLFLYLLHLCRSYFCVFVTGAGSPVLPPAFQKQTVPAL